MTTPKVIGEIFDLGCSTRSDVNGTVLEQWLNLSEQRSLKDVSR